MHDDLYFKELTRFKEQERPEVVLFLSNDSDLTKIAIACAFLTFKPVAKISSPPVEPDNETWEWLWENTNYDKSKLAEITNIPEYFLNEKLKPLIGNRILYPDGTINLFVQRFINEKVMKLFTRKEKRSGRAGKRE